MAVAVDVALQAHGLAPANFPDPADRKQVGVASVLRVRSVVAASNGRVYMYSPKGSYGLSVRTAGLSLRGWTCMRGSHPRLKHGQQAVCHGPSQYTLRTGLPLAVCWWLVGVIVLSCSACVWRVCVVCEGIITMQACSNLRITSEAPLLATALPVTAGAAGVRP
jgi:hypothetical protein